MSRRGPKGRLGRELPWAALLQSGYVLTRRWQKLSEKDRARLRRLVTESRGRITSLSAKERKELRKLAAKLDLAGAGRELLPLLRGLRARRWRR